MTFSPVRRVVTRSGKKIRGNFASFKMGAMVPWESPIEADAIRLFEFNPGVVSYCSQPSHEVYYDTDGNAHGFVPDFRVDFHRGGSIWVEIKSDADVEYPPTARTLGLKALALKEQGRRYRVLSAKQIGHQPRSDNIILLERCSKARLSPETVESLQTIDHHGTFAVRELVSIVGNERAVYRCIAYGCLRTDLLSPLTLESRVWHPNNTELGDGAFPI